MSPELLWSIGTLLKWAGWFFLFRGAWLGIKLLVNNPGLNRALTARGMAIAFGVGAVLLMLGLAMPKELGRPDPPGWNLPLVWWLADWKGLLVLVSGILIVVRLVQSFTALTALERKQRLGAAAVWLVLGIIGLVLFTQTGSVVRTYRGVIGVQPEHVGIVIGLLIAASWAMVAAERYARTRGIARTIVIQLTLLAGCVVFGLPFVWLLITSFKEDRDMSAAAGIVWVPRIQVTVPYDNPKRPLVDATYEGQAVEALVRVDEVRPDGKLNLEVERPLSLRGREFAASESEVRRKPRMVNVVTAEYAGQTIKAFVKDDLPDGSTDARIMEPKSLEGRDIIIPPGETDPYRVVGLRWQNYTDALEWLPPETHFGLTYLRNTLFLVIMSVLGVVLSSSFVAYGFSRLRFPMRGQIFSVMLATMMLPGAVTMLPGFLIMRSLGWIDTLYPLWVPAFFAGAFNVFLLRQFFMTIPMELEDSAKIDGCTYLRTYWQIMMPQVKPALAVIAIWTFMGTWNNFMGPLIFLNTPEKMPIAYAVQLFQGDRGGEFGLMMAFATMATIPVLLLFFFAQKYFIEGVQLSGLGGR